MSWIFEEQTQSRSLTFPVRDGIGHEANVAGDSRPAGAYVRRSRYVAGGSALLILRINDPGVANTDTRLL